MQLIPVKGSVFENLPLVSNKELMDLRKSCEPTLRQMYHCKQCRADAVGLLGDDRSIDYRPPAAAQPTQEAPATPVARGIRIAVASKTGATVDQHFGQTDQFYIYESDGAAARYLETRSVSRYCHGMDNCGSGKTGRMDGILAAVEDCKGVLALRIGQSPLEKLQQKGIRVFTLYETVDKAVNEAAKALCG